MYKFIETLKTIKWMILLSIIAAVVFIFINPMYTIILCVFEIAGFIMGFKCISAVIPENFDEWRDEWKKEMNEFLEQAKNIDND